jgi:hypothetical protein
MTIRRIMPLSPEAMFDSLFMADRLQRQTGTFTPPELHLFGYLACLLWLYSGHAVTDWGYSFAGTELGAPFSVEIDSAVKLLVERGYFAQIDDRISMSGPAEQSLQEFSRLTLTQERAKCLHAACASTAALSAGMVGNALAQEPDLKRAQLTPMSRPLLEDLARSELYVHFDALRKGLQQKGTDLRMPAVVWLAALYRSSVLNA